MNSNNMKTTKKTFWGATAFYLLIAFEFFYMASPFAGYFYFIYRPVLNFLNNMPVLDGLVTYFLPHFARTSSAIINMHNILGSILFVLGLLAFGIGACQVYYHKLAKKGIVTGGVYNYIRHPQYASFIICSFGLLLLWPRYIVLVMFITMLFAYYYLARAEEKECELKYGQSYTDYKNKTGMFFPFRMPFMRKRYFTTQSRYIRILAGFGSYLIILAMTIGIAKWIDNCTLNSLYAIYQDDSANISISKIEPDKLAKILNIAFSNETIKARIEKAGTKKKAKLLNYILPSQWYAAEIPMNGIDVNRNSHSMPVNYNLNLYKVIITRAALRFNNGIVNNETEGKAILRNIAGRDPILEVWVDTAQNKVTKILEMPKKIMYQNIPVALY